jgi:hypothetical protein
MDGGDSGAPSHIPDALGPGSLESLLPGRFSQTDIRGRLDMETAAADVPAAPTGDESIPSHARAGMISEGEVPKSIGNGLGVISNRPGVSI